MIPALDKKVPVWLCGADSKNIVKSLGTSTSSEKQELGTITGVMSRFERSFYMGPKTLAVKNIRNSQRRRADQSVGTDFFCIR